MKVLFVSLTVVFQLLVHNTAMGFEDPKYNLSCVVGYVLDGFKHVTTNLNEVLSDDLNDVPMGAKFSHRINFSDKDLGSFSLAVYMYSGGMRKLGSVGLRVVSPSGLMITSLNHKDTLELAAFQKDHFKTVDGKKLKLLEINVTCNVKEI